MTKLLAAVLVLSSCAATPSPRPSVPRTVITKACEAPERRQLDFWIGDWTVTVRARASSTSDAWAESVGTQHVTSILSGCAIEENFHSEAPNAFAGKSVSTYDANTQSWRQTWVDDSGSYLAFTGGLEGSDFVLHGEPRTKDGTRIQMRMVFSAVTKSSLHWEWQRTEDAWATHALMMSIDYRRL